ncbi:hypothetical protein ACGFIV_10365 [Sphaerisporangium sp. NPDC049003]|uniref:hypothetical protein n=1 Tax=Sphaerisporangium sp. NPDC049003 TaxID=3364517 RepID=UPI00371F0E28
MLRRLVALGISAALLTACGAQDDGQPDRTPTPGSVAAPAQTVGPEDAIAAFGLLKELDDAWKKHDCAKVAFLTTSAAGELGARACEAVKNGRPAPAPLNYSDADYFLPDHPAERPWFVALAHEPRPSYFLFVREEDRWRLAYGPIRVLGAAPDLDTQQTTRAVPTDDPDDGVRARLVPQKHLAFLSDRAGLSGVRFASGDPMRALLAELIGKPATVRPDRLSSDVQLVPSETRALGLADGGALVFHALKIVYTQKTGARGLAHPLFGAGAVRAFTGKPGPKAIHAAEVVLLATKVTADGKLTTVAMTRGLADITA